MSESKDVGGIAVVGIGLRYPGSVDDGESFWKLLCSKRCTHSAAPSSRYNANGHAQGVSQGGHFLADDMGTWDSTFFGITPQEADVMDPQQKVLLQVTYEALENAGIRMDDISGSRTGCWIGFSSSDWRELMYRDCDAAPLFAEISSHPASLSGRVSWFFDLRGPSVSLNTACSSSLTAVAAACDSLRLGAVDTALVGAVSLMVSPDTWTGLKRQRFLSPDGLCKTFDAQGNGFGRGEGVGVLVLRRADVARQAGDPVRGILSAYGVNHNGRTGGITDPRSEAQVQLIRHVYSTNRLDPRQTVYVEAHGTGTAAGDPAELEAIEHALGAVVGRRGKLLLGSVKPNIGHSEGAAGMAGLIKSILSLEKGYIPPTAGIKQLTPKFPWEQNHLEVVQELTPLPDIDGCRRISVSCFGATGTNAHVVVESAPKLSAVVTDSLTPSGVQAAQTRPNWLSMSVARHWLFAFTAHTPEALERYIAGFIRYLNEDHAALSRPSLSDHAFLSSLAYTLAARRSVLSVRCCIAASSTDDLATALETRALRLRQAREQQQHDASKGRRKGAQSCRLVFIFTGQGAQWPRMGAGLLQFSRFRETVVSADRYIQSELGAKWSPMQELLHSEGESNIDGPEYSQALCTVLQIALIDLLSGWNIRPDVAIGHSSGEIAAAYCSGALDKESCYRLAYWRGVVSSRLADGRGAMLVAAISPHEGKITANDLNSRGNGSVTVACENSPRMVTFAGDRSAIESLRQKLELDRIWCRLLAVKVAYHSPHMQRAVSEYMSAISDILPSPEVAKRCTMISSLTSHAAEAEELGPSYWARNLINPVLFAPALQNLLLTTVDASAANEFFFEIGPHSTLASAVRETLDDFNRTNAAYASALSRGKDDTTMLFTSLALLYEQNVPVSLVSANSGTGDDPTPPILTSLPHYAWGLEGQYKLPSRLVKAYVYRTHGKGSLLGTPLPTSTKSVLMWRSWLSLDDHPWLSGHVINRATVIPATIYLSMVMEAGPQLNPNLSMVHQHCFQNLAFLAATTIRAGQRMECILAVQSSADTNMRPFSISITSDDDESQHEVCTGLWGVQQCPETHLPEAEVSLQDSVAADEFVRSCQASNLTTMTAEEYYDLSFSRGYRFEGAFRQLERISTNGVEAHATVRLGESSRIGSTHNTEQDSVIHPATLDAFLNIPVAALLCRMRNAHVPISISRLEVSSKLNHGTSPKAVEVAVRSQMTSTHSASSLIRGVDADSRQELIKIEGLHSAEISDTADLAAKITCSQYLWAPDFSILTAEQARSALQLTRPWNNDVCDSSNIASIISYLAQNTPRATILHIGEHGDEYLADLICTPADGIPRVYEYNWCPITPGDVCLAELTLAEELFTWTVDRATRRPSWRARAGLDASETFDMVIVTSNSTSLSTTLVGEISRLLQKHWKTSSLLCLVGRPSVSTLLEPMSNRLGLESICHGAKVDSENVGLVVMRQAPGAPSTDSTCLTAARAEPKSTRFTILLPALADSGRLTEDFCTGLLQELKNAGLECSVNRFGSATSLLPGTTVIALLELEQSFFEHLADPHLTLLRQITAKVQVVHWVVALQSPLRALASGFAHSVRHECPQLQFRTAHLQLLAPESVTSSIQLLFPIFVGQTYDREHWQDPETGLLMCPRVVPDAILSSSISLRIATSSAIAKPAERSLTCIHLRAHQPGNLDSIGFAQSEVGALTGLAPDEVEVRVIASGMTFKDVMIATGKMRRHALGGEASGVVERVGEDVHSIQTGDRVLLLAPGAHTSILRVRAAFCRIIPPMMNFAEAASIPVNHITAFHALFNIAHSQSQEKQGRSILIHAAAGGVGQIMIQMAQYLKMHIFATVSSQFKRDLLIREYGLQPDHILSSRDTSFGPAIRRMTAGKGVDLVVNSLAGDLARESWTCLASPSTFVELGKTRQVYQQPNDVRDVHFVAFDLENMIRDRPQLISDYLDSVIELSKQGITRPVTPFQVQPAGEASDVFRAMASGKHTGKSVLLWDTLGPTRFTREVIPRLPMLTLNPSGTYLLVGGLGGLGRSLAYHLAQHGAQHLCFLSRSGLSAANTRAQQLVSDLQGTFGINVQCYVCDVGDYEQLKAAVDQCTRQAPPICGVVQAAMALQDTVLANMTPEQWEQSLKPKVAGTWNLHQLFAQNSLDFFILLSSFVTIIGNPGQTNYSAACAYQDDLARYRRSRGMKCVSINLGVMKDVGVLVDGTVASTTALREWEHFEGIREHEFLRLIATIINDQTSNSGRLPAVLPTGIPSTKRKFDGELDLDATRWLCDPRFALLDNHEDGPAYKHSRHSDQAAVLCHISTRRKLASCKSTERAEAVILAALIDKCHEWLQLPPGSIDESRSLSDYGFNSLSAIETQNWLSRDLEIQANMLDLLSNKSIAELSRSFASAVVGNHM